MESLTESRRTLILRVERTALIGRYVAFFLIAPLYIA